jgi:chlorophyll synthase
LLPYAESGEATRVLVRAPRSFGGAQIFNSGIVIMVLNDFKSIGGDKTHGIRSIPAQLGADRAARLACIVMAAAQIAVVAMLIAWQAHFYAALVALGIAMQFALMRRLLADPRANAPWYNATGTSLYVLGMLASAFALADLMRLS